jgi:Domain of unknown function (DUF3597)
MSYPATVVGAVGHDNILPFPVGRPGAGCGRTCSDRKADVAHRTRSHDREDRRPTAGGNWQESIVDLMKLSKLDSSLGARKQLAKELGYTGALDGSAEMNVWLHRQVMVKLAESGGKVPEHLKA